MLHVTEMLASAGNRSERERGARRARLVLVQHGLGALLCLTLSQGVAQAADGGVPNMDAGTSTDAGGDTSAGGNTDASAGSSDAGTSADAGRPLTAACSCETNSGAGELEIHLCTGSFEREACSRFSCGNGTVRSASCARRSAVRLCCDMKSRDLYTYLYDDCTHPNCESGFRAQCADFAGDVLAGPCDSTDLPEDPDTELGEEAACSVAHVGSEQGKASGFGLSWLALGFLIRRKARSSARAPGR